jgi:ABC-type Fe3+-siderophore transport system permease subunit
VLVGGGIGAISVVLGNPNAAQSGRVPLFWAGAVAGFVCALWLFQIGGAIDPPADPNRANALAGFAAIGAFLYGLIPFFIARRPDVTAD